MDPPDTDMLDEKQAEVQQELDGTHGLIPGLPGLPGLPSLTQALGAGDDKAVRVQLYKQP